MRSAPRRSSSSWRRRRQLQLQLPRQARSHAHRRQLLLVAPLQLQRLLLRLLVAVTLARQGACQVQDTLCAPKCWLSAAPLRHHSTAQPALLCAPCTPGTCLHRAGAGGAAKSSLLDKLQGYDYNPEHVASEDLEYPGVPCRVASGPLLGCGCLRATRPGGVRCEACASVFPCLTPGVVCHLYA
jgi:hypothetical protein